MPLESLAISLGTFITLIGGIWYLASKIQSLFSNQENTKEDVNEMKGDVSQLKQDMSAIKAIVDPERHSVPAPRKRARR